MTRLEDIDYDFLANDRIWPPGIAPNHFVKALVEVLKRLSDDAYDTVSERVSFVIEDPRILAVNVPFKRIYPACPSEFEIRFDTIVIFHQALEYPRSALVGLLAHELAHSFVSNGQDYEADEAETSSLVIDWGFDIEHKACLDEQLKAKNQSSSQ